MELQALWVKTISNKEILVRNNMKKYKFTIRGNEYDVQIHNIEDNTAEIEVNGTTYSVDINN